MAVTSTLDHLLLGTSDLDAGIAFLESKTGVRAVVGGNHPGFGTRNALVSMGGRQYLEIIAPDPNQTIYTFPIDLHTLNEPRLITWAAATADITAVATKVSEAGHPVLGPQDGSRTRLDGKTLRWKILRVVNAFGLQGIEPIPFFIEWDAESLHPSQDSPRGCEFLSFGIEHPKAPEIKNLLKAVGIQARVQEAEHCRLTATLKTPKGIVELI